MTEPVDLSERTLTNLSNSIVAGITGVRGSSFSQQNNSQQPATGGRGWDQELQRLFTGGQNLMASVGLLTQGTYGLAQASGDISKVISLFGPVGAGIGQFGNAVVGVALATNQQMMNVSRSGYTFDQNLGLFSKAVLGAHMSLPGFERFVNEAGKSLGGLATSASSSGMMYLRMLQAISENEDNYKMKVSGLDDFDRTLQLSASMSRNQNMLTERGYRAVIDSAVSMGIEMDNIARLTGKSRQEQQKAIETQMQKNEMEIMLMAMTEEEQTAYKDNLTSMGKFGKGMGDLMTEMTVGEGNVVSEKGTKIAAALDAAAPGVTALMSQLSKETDAAKRKQLQDEIDIKMANLVEDKAALKQFAVMTAQGKSDIMAISGEIIAGSKGYLLVLDKARKEAAENGGNEITILNRMKSEYALKRSTLPSDPGADPNEALSKTINQGEIFMKQLSSGFGDTLSGMNTKIGTSITQFDGLNNALGVRIQSELSVATQLDKFGRMAGYTGVATDATNVSPRYRDQLPKIDGAKALGDEAIPAGWQGLVGEKGPEILKVGAQSSIKSNTVSMGLLDQAVTKLPIMMSGMQNDLKMAMNEAKNSMPSVNDFQSLLTNFKTSISSTSQQPTGPQSSISTSTDFESALSKGIDMLNTSVKQLITAVEDGTYKNVKAVKNSGNMLA
jgi:hypothetical protein